MRGDRLPFVQPLANASAATSEQTVDWLRAEGVLAQSVKQHEHTLTKLGYVPPARRHAVGRHFMDGSTRYECAAAASPSYNHSQTHLRQHLSRPLIGSAQNVVHAQSVRRRACMLVATVLCIPTSFHGVGKRVMDDSTGFECVVARSPTCTCSQTHLRQHLSRPASPWAQTNM